jgi:hypothetical protein
MGASEGKLLPGKSLRGKEGNLFSLLPCPRVSSDDSGKVNDGHHGRLSVGIHVE